MESEWACYRGDDEWRENGHVTEEVSIMEENGHVMEVAS